MSKNKTKKSVPVKKAPKPAKTSQSLFDQPWLWVAVACVITAVVFFPMLSNAFTNWDDQFYITENVMLRGPDWSAIFSRPLMANYHPLTVASLALNYQLSEVNPFSYHLVNWLVHIANTGLVFLLAYQLSTKNLWVGMITALLFGLHPMHVESVAWASERKDVLYTFFFLLALLVYWKYLGQQNIKNYGLTLLLFLLSLLSKPAAVTFPVVLLLMDWYKGRSLKDQKVWLEKIPFFALSIFFGLLTIKYQQNVKAIAEADMYPLWQKLVFSFYGFGEYIKRFVWPFPLSAIHPFPDSGTIPGSYIPSMILSVIALAGAWYYRKKKFILFGLAFFTINIALVLQLLTFGHAIIAERYTYVPYIGLAFLIAMVWAKSNLSEGVKKIALGVVLMFCLGFAIASFQQVKVWKNGETLWSHAIETYPDSYIARSNRGQYLSSKLAKYEMALEDYAIALRELPNDSFSLVNRATIYINQQNYPAAYADADSLIKHTPRIAKGHLFRGIASFYLDKPDQAYSDLTNGIQLDPNMEEAWSFRGVVNYNKRQDYNAAKTDFDRAIELNPEKGLNYKNRARCWVKFGNKAEALKDIETAQRLGEQINPELMQAVQALPG